jgi:large subunit ribosomal protein L6
MSRVGKQPVKIPAGVKALVADGLVTVEGPRGKLQYQLGPGVQAECAEGVVHVKSAGGTKQISSNYGSARAHINNMVIGVTKGWKRSLEINGVGYTVALAGSKLTLKVGFSHEVEIILPKEISCQVQKSSIELVSHDKQAIGNIAATIRRVRPPEPYLGKGIKYTEEVIKRKAGKTTK